MDRYFVIAKTDGDPNLIAKNSYVLLRFPESQVINMPEADIVSGIVSLKMEVYNADVQDGKLVGSMNTFDRLPKIDIRSGNISGKMSEAALYTVLYRLSDSEYVVSDIFGGTNIATKDHMLKLSRKFGGFTNCKVAVRDGSIVVSAIKGHILELSEIASDENDEIALFVINGLIKYKMLGNATKRVSKEIMSQMYKNDPSIFIDLLLHFSIGPIRAAVEKDVIRLVSMNGDLKSACYNDYTSKHSLPSVNIHKASMKKVRRDFKLRVERLAYSGKYPKQAILLVDSFVLGSDYSVISTDRQVVKVPYNIPSESISEQAVHTAIVQEVLKKVTADERPLQKQQAREVKQADKDGKKIQKAFSRFTEEVWVCEVGWEPLLEDIAEQIGFKIDPERNYCYVLTDIEKVEEMEYVAAMIMEEPHRNYTSSGISKVFNVELLDLNEERDGFATIKFSYKDNESVGDYKKKNLLKTIMEVR